jgi:hypothetical protein
LFDQSPPPQNRRSGWELDWVENRKRGQALCADGGAAGVLERVDDELGAELVL